MPGYNLLMNGAGPRERVDVVAAAAVGGTQVAVGGEPLAVEFANTVRPHRRSLVDELADPAAAVDWLLARAGHFGPALAAGDLAALDRAGLARLHVLRAAVRDALQATVDGTDIPDTARTEINVASSLSPRWPVLDCVATIEIVCGTGIDPVAEAAASIAQSAVHVLGGPARELLRQCPAEGCPMFFVKDHPRRAWCTPACGNRNRVARHARNHAAAAAG